MGFHTSSALDSSLPVARDMRAKLTFSSSPGKSSEDHDSGVGAPSLRSLRCSSAGPFPSLLVLGSLTHKVKCLFHRLFEIILEESGLISLVVSACTIVKRVSRYDGYN